MGAKPWKQTGQPRAAMCVEQLLIPVMHIRKAARSSHSRSSVLQYVAGRVRVYSWEWSSSPNQEFLPFRGKPLDKGTYSLRSNIPTRWLEAHCRVVPTNAVLVVFLLEQQQQQQPAVKCDPPIGLPTSSGSSHACMYVKIQTYPHARA